LMWIFYSSLFITSRTEAALLFQGEKMNILSIDPGYNGYLCLLAGSGADFFPMPIIEIGKIKEINFASIQATLQSFKMLDGGHVFLERAMPMAMGAKHAFNYGRGFAALEIAIKLSGLPVTYVEPRTWQKIMFAGVDQKLKPKEQALVAVERLATGFNIPKNSKGRFHDGAVDALLIGLYGQRILTPPIVSSKI
jgi:hypothetical protein